MISESNPSIFCVNLLSQYYVSQLPQPTWQGQSKTKVTDNCAMTVIINNILPLLIERPSLVIIKLIRVCCCCCVILLLWWYHAGALTGAGSWACCLSCDSWLGVASSRVQHSSQSVSQSVLHIHFSESSRQVRQSGTTTSQQERFSHQEELLAKLSSSRGKYESPSSVSGCQHGRSSVKSRRERDHTQKSDRKVGKKILTCLQFVLVSAQAK